MKKTHRIFFAAPVLLLALVFASARSSAHLETAAALDYADTAASISAREASSSRPGTIPEKMRERYDDRVENLQNNQEIRRSMLEERRDRTATGSDDRAYGRNAASTSRPLGAKKTIVHADIFERQKNHIAMQLNRALANLNQIRGRINSRIEKSELSGRDMKKAKVLLAIADQRLADAKTAIDALILLSPHTLEAASATSSPSGDIVDLTRPRIAGSLAIQSVQDAKRALNDVVVEIAHAMGLKIGQTGATSAATTTAPTAASTTGTTTP